MFQALKTGGIDFATGVPCGVQRALIACLANDAEIVHAPATREAEAIGIAAGAYLAGKKPLVYMQNSGLMDSINEISSLLLPYQIPVLFSVTWRGFPGETAPQHFVNGRVTTKILDAVEIPYENVTKDNVEAAVAAAFFAIEDKHLPAVLLIVRGGL